MTACLMMLASAMGFAAEGDDETVFTRERAFRIPLELTDAERKSAAGIRLMVSTDSGKTWSRVREESPKRSTVTFRAPGDGCYWLALAVIGHDEKRRPLDDADLKPGLKVIIDSAKPDVGLEAVKTRSGLRGVRWTIKDGSPTDEQKLQCAAWDDRVKAWKPRALGEVRNNTVWFGRNEVVTKMQLAVTDAAGNESVAQIDIDGDRFLCCDQEAFVLANRAPTPTQFAENAKPRTETRETPEIEQAGHRSAEASEKLTTVEKPAELKSVAAMASPMPSPNPATTKAAKPPVETTFDEPPALPDPEPVAPKKAVDKKPLVPVVPELVEVKATATKPVLPSDADPMEVKTTVKNMATPIEAEPVEVKSTATKPVESDADGEVSYSNRRTTVLHYEMTAAPKGELVELWGIKQGSKEWTRIGRDEDGVSPMEAAFPEDGRWGITLVYGDMSGSGKPAKEEAPAATVEVDTKRPKIAIGDVRMEKSSVRLSWKASDAHLVDDCIRISWSRDTAGPWQMIAVQQACEGDYVWKPSDEGSARAMYFRFDATDRAGNIGSAITATPLRKARSEIVAPDDEPTPARKQRKTENASPKEE